MRKQHFITGVIVAAIAVTASSVLAYGQNMGDHGFGPGHRLSFEELDADDDGQITQSEMAKVGAARFDNVDTDGNGVLSAAELQAQGQQRVAERVAGLISRFDKNGDGALSQAEMPGNGRSDRMIEHIDTDDSGGISQEEFSQAQAQMQSRNKGQRGKHRNKN